MNREQFEALVSRNQRQSAAAPRWYKFRVVLMAFGGYLYLGSIIVLLLASIAALVGIVVFTHRGSGLLLKVGLFPLLMLGLVLRALWVHFPKPTGLRITREEAPELFNRVDAIQKSLGASAVHRVLLTDQLNAALVQHPRLGVLGWQENYLICGLPLMAATSKAGFESVIAHELGHLRQGDGRLFGWIGRTILTWERLGDSISGDAGSAWLFKGFYEWWMPRLQAMNAVLSRQQEFAADAAAVEWGGKQAAGETLLLLETAGEEAETRFWQTMFKRSLIEPEAPIDPFTQYTLAMHDRSDESLMRRSIQEAFARQTHSTASHPSLRERLAAFNFVPVGTDLSLVSVPPPPQATAAQELLGEALSKSLNHFDMAWRTPIAQKWKESHETAKTDAQRLSELEAKDELDLEEQVELAQLHKTYRDPALARQRLQTICESHPEHAIAAFVLGRSLLEERDGAGVALLERSMANPDIVEAACRELHTYYERIGQREQANRMVDRLQEHARSQDDVLTERLTFPELAAIEPITEPYPGFEKLVDWLQSDPKILAAYLIKRHTRLRREVPAFALLVVPRKPFFTTKNETEMHDKAMQNLMDHAPISEHTFLFVAMGVLKKVPGFLEQRGIVPIVRKR